MTILAGEFWLANIPFTDGTAAKKRPVLMLWLDGRDVVVAVVTSAAPRTVTDVALANWQQSGLRVSSTVRLSRLDCLEHSLMLVKLGAVTRTDAQTLQSTWQHYVNLQF